MEIIDPEQKRNYETRGAMDSYRQHDPKGRILAGIIILAVGALLLFHKLGVYFPSWLFSWQMLVIAVGLFLGAKENFRPGGWIGAVLVGVFFLLPTWWPEWNLRPYFWPAVLMMIGAVMIFTPGSRFRRRKNNGVDSGSENSSDDIMECVSIFGGNKKNIITKNFKGGESVCVFGGSEINLSQSDIQGRVELEIVQVFGGTKLILPPHWQLKTEMVSILGGIEDTRIGQKDQTSADKILVLKGLSIFGGISIKSF